MVWQRPIKFGTTLRDGHKRDDLTKVIEIGLSLKNTSTLQAYAL